MPYAMLQKCRNFTMHILINIIIIIIIVIIIIIIIIIIISITIIIIIILFFNLVRYGLLNIHVHCQLWYPLGK